MANTEEKTDRAPWRWTVGQAQAAPVPHGQISAELFTHGSMALHWYEPKGADRQTPHTQDELYVVVRGSGRFYCGSMTFAFGPGDVLFAPAGMDHRFENFTDDFATWVIFYGKEGGEAQG